MQFMKNCSLPFKLFDVDERNGLHSGLYVYHVANR